MNIQAIALEEAETKIRQTVKDLFFKRQSKAIINQAIFKIIKEASKQIKIEALKRAAEQSLLKFYENQYRELERSFSWQLPILSALFLLLNKTLSGGEIKPTKREKEEAMQILEAQGYDRSRLLGVPLQKFSNDYVKENVAPAIDRLVKQFPKDPGDISGRNSLRNRAEMEVRYNAHLDSINDFKREGTNLVICSTHADCSKRCAPYQGRVYSLDGTSGVTDDGRKYVPLEEATDVYYTTKAGVTYKNGLLGFNCRHFLVAYKSGYKFPKPNVKEERKEYEITEKQRAYEYQVRKWRTKAIENKNINIEEYLKAKRKAEEWNKEYINFSKKNNRPYYPSRTKVI